MGPSTQYLQNDNKNTYQRINMSITHGIMIIFNGQLQEMLSNSFVPSVKNIRIYLASHNYPPEYSLWLITTVSHLITG
jgi:hypothetical protein